ncbi:alpha/beta fold hydrolase [Stenomitos frigidus]|uniref:Alpha/beta hydrolase n=1 Tax=Stenomitos frigidus ULC18 TaxID=2107698 RepID=A0A2T1DTF4_9CYAN|nr:alpha/beta hydrolase [Stenomitos frigidus]PSB23789.1 alpha/beta hydrolase [Stenomitos frigidus ULC18]
MTQPTLAHEIIGNGPEKVIVMGGWLGDHTVFQPIYPWLDRTTFTYCFADPRGYGASQSLVGNYTNSEAAGDVAALATSLGWETFHYIGHSMMGKVAQYLSAHYSTLLRSVIGVTPVPASAVPFDEEAHKLFATAWEVPANRGTICMLTTGNRHTNVWEQYMVSESLRTTHPDAYRGYFQMWSTEDFAAEVDGCEVPFLAITGEHDAGVPTALVKDTILQWFKKAELHVMSNAGHYPMQEVPIQFVTTCEAFMSRYANG